MKWLSRHLEGKYFQMKLVVTSIICAVCAVLVTGFGLNRVHNNAMDTVSVEFLSNLVSQISLNIDDHLTQIKSLVFSVEVDNEIIQDLQKVKNGGTLSLDEIRLIQKKLLQCQMSRNDIQGFYIFDAKGNAIYHTSSPSLELNYDISQEWWLSAEMEENYKGPFFISSYVPERYLLEKEKVVTYVEKLTDIMDRKYLATIEMDINLKMFENIMNNMKLSDEMAVYILDKNGNMVFSSKKDRSEEGERLFQSYLINEEKNYAGQDGENHVAYHECENTDWIVISCTNIGKLTGITKSTRKSTMVILITMALFTAAGIWTLVNKNMGVLKELKGGMKEVRRGNYNIQIPETQRDEIGELCQTFNKMTRQIKSYILHMEKLEKEKSEIMLKNARAELDFLQAQINPHFIYNTLESISMMAELNDDEETQEMAVSLGKLLRIGINRGENSVRVREELEHVSSYLKIQEIRFGDKITSSFDIQEGIVDYQIPKLILQPLVENSIYHGLEMKKESGEIKIIGYESDNSLIFKIIDNGIGMNEETLEMVRKQIQITYESEYYSSRSIGLINVNQRIRLYYQDNSCGLYIDSKPDKGTTIVVHLKKEVAHDSDNIT